MPRASLPVLVGLLFTLAAAAGPDARYGIDPDAKTYPQGTAKEALASVIKAIEARRVDYVVAQLADPGFIDDRVKRVYGGRFEEQVEDTQGRLGPATLKQLQRFAKEGKWTIDEERASVDLDADRERVVRFTRKGGRWYLENRSDTGIK